MRNATLEAIQQDGLALSMALAIALADREAVLRGITVTVRERLQALGASAEVLAAWRQLVAQKIEAESDEDEFDY